MMNIPVKRLFTAYADLCRTGVSFYAACSTATGFLMITDRKKHLIVNSGGKNIAPGPLESAFLQSSLISQILIKVY